MPKPTRRTKTPPAKLKRLALFNARTMIENVRVSGEFPRVGSKRLTVTVRGFQADDGTSPSLLLAPREATSAGKGS